MHTFLFFSKYMMNLFIICLDIISSFLRTTKKFVVSFELFSQLNFILIDYHFCILDFFSEDGSRVQSDWLFYEGFCEPDYASKGDLWGFLLNRKKSSLHCDLL